MRRFPFILALGLCLALWSRSAAAADRENQGGFYTEGEAQALFQEANTAYARGDAAAAIRIYERLIQHGRGGPDVLFNLGTAHVAAGNLGEAALALERAWKMGDRREDLAAQLAYLQSKQVDQVMGAEGEPLAVRIARATSPLTVCVVFAVMYLGAWSLVFARWLRPAFRRPGTWAAAVGLGLGALVAGGVVAAHVYAFSHAKEAVVVAGTLPARPAPDANANPSFEMHAGLKVRVLERVGQFARVQLGNGLTGWVQQDGIADL